MDSLKLQTWMPTAEHFEHSGVARMMRALGVANYDELLTLSLEHPARYWEVIMGQCGIVWNTPPSSYLDESAGPEFPSWFPGGRLNWVNSVLAWARHAETANRVAVIAERENGAIERLTYAELETAVREFSAGLIRHGVGRGDRVGLLMENGIEATISLLAISYIGAVTIPLFSGFGTDAIVARLSAADASVVLATAGFSRRGKWIAVEPTLREACAKLPSVEKLIWKSATNSSCRGPHEFEWNAILHSGRGIDQSPEILNANEPFMVIFTSGTTGKPKGVVHVHGGFPVKMAHDAVIHFDVRPHDVFCWPADMGWIAGAVVLSSALMRGATLVCYDGAPDFPDWSRMSRLVERHQVTHLGSAPTLIRGMASNGDLAVLGDVSSVRLLITAGEGIDPEHFNWFQQTFGRGSAPLINYTGGTEVSGALLSSVVVRPIPPSGFNTTSPGIDVDIVDSAGHPVTGSLGELVVRRPFVGMTQSFWNDDERYLDTYWRTIPGMWVHGDLALRREDGNFFMMGRSDDTLKVAGKRLGPAEVEEIVLELPQIAEAAAIGVSDAEKGQRLVVFITLSTTADEVEHIESTVALHVQTRLGRPFRPSATHCVSELPKTRSSKIMRRVIRSVYCDQPTGDLSSLDNPSSLSAIRSAAGRRES